MADNRIAGVCYLKADGQQFALKGDLTINIDKVTRTGVAGADRVHGFTETVNIPFISGTVSLTSDLSIEKLQEMTDVTVVAELANGKSYILRNAWSAESRELNASEGQTPVRFEGKSGEELT
ncbi:MAG: phage tail protein [Rhodospirillaceae bacterium]|nr:MAG: phage tail protein [Rhodospirillaceae bacterium]